LAPAVGPGVFDLSVRPGKALEMVVEKRHVERAWAMKTIRMKLLVPIVCAIVVGGLFMGYASYRMTSEVIINSGRDDGLRSVRNLREIIELVTSTAYLDLSALAADPTIIRLLRKTGSPRELEARMRGMTKRQPLYNNIQVLNSSGYVIASSPVLSAENAAVSRADRDYFQASMRGDNFISQVETSRQTGRLVTFISIAVNEEPPGRVIGVLMASLRLEAVSSRHVAPVALQGNHGYAMIINNKGQIVGHKDASKIGDRISEELQQRLAAMGDSPIAFEAVLDGTPSLLFAERSPSIGWLSMVVCPVKDFYSTTDYLARINIVLAGSAILMSAIVIWLTVRGVTEALSAAIRYASTVAHDDLGAVLPVTRSDEVGLLAQSLRDMVNKLKHMITVAEEKSRAAEEATEEIISGIVYASNIQKSMLPKAGSFQKAFSDYSVIWAPRDIVGGDIYWMKNFSKGTILCVCDCTGHGTPGALLTMLAVSAFESAVDENNYQDTAQIVWELEKRFVAALHVKKTELNRKGGEKIWDIRDGCDIAVLYIAKDGQVAVSAGHTHVFVCNGKEVRQIKGQNLHIGEGRLMGKDSVATVMIPADPDNKFYIASDGLYDQIGGEFERPFGYRRFKQIILEKHNEKQEVISGAIWEAFETYRGGQSRRDDLQLISFKP
jgi:serine phosphatase RsbU (regulator of sigma subunit)